MFKKSWCNKASLFSQRDADFSPSVSTEVLFYIFFLSIIKRDAGLCHQFVQTMNGCLWSGKLSRWLFSNLAAPTVSRFEIRKHVIYSPSTLCSHNRQSPLQHTTAFQYDLKITLSSPSVHHRHHLQP